MSTNTHVAAIDRQHERIVRPSDDAYGGTDRRILVKSVYDLYSDYVSPVIGRFISNEDDDDDDDADEDDEDEDDADEDEDENGDDDDGDADEDGDDEDEDEDEEDDDADEDD